MLVVGIGSRKWSLRDHRHVPVSEEKELGTVTAGILDVWRVRSSKMELPSTKLPKSSLN